MPADPDGGMLLPHCDDDDLSFWCRQLFNDDHPQSVLPDNFLVGSLPDNLLSFDLSWPTIGEYTDLTSHGNLPPASLSDAPLSEASQHHQPPTTSSAEICRSAHGSHKNGLPSKIGTRFSQEALRTLKDWLNSNSDHPYPDEEEREMLQRQTGLNKTQISNWLTNARRRRKVQHRRSTSPSVRNNCTGPIDIPRRPNTPAFEINTNLNPLERWVDSPPENEPASVTAIAQAVALNSKISLGLKSPSSLISTDDGSNPSLYNASSASSAGTSSGASFGSMTRQRGRRRRRRPVPKRKEKLSSAVPLKKFQCTFCAGTFGTKYDWQRHEKSLHLSLERWMCAPNGPRVLNPQSHQNCCTFCGEVEPSDEHIESHNLLACMERRPEDRTFYRKDHLNQHLRLMHNVKFLDWSMKSWKVTGPDIRSRCGFCGIVMSNWSARVDHLAEHFRNGNTMAAWRGDWGFEAPVLKMVENFIPPYLIENERRSPFPYVATAAPTESPESAYDLSLQGIAARTSWLRDLLMASEAINRRAQTAPLRQGSKNRLSILKINGEDNMFEQCPLENQLYEFVWAKGCSVPETLDVGELQQEACRIIRRTEEASTTPSSFIVDWLVRLINSSNSWLHNFRQRAHLPRTEGTCVKPQPTIFQAQRRELNEMARTQSPRMFFGGCSEVIPSTVAGQAGAFFLTDANCYRRLFRELTRFVTSIMSPNNPNCHVPTDAEIQHQARCIIFDDDDPWNQTAADNAEWLLRFKRDVGILSSGPGLSLDTNAWNITHGGTGFAPPYVFPNKRMLHATPSTTASVNIPSGTNDSTMMTNLATTSPCFDKVEIFIGNNATPFETNQALLDWYIEAFPSRYDRPATVFCSRELESGLVGFVEAEIARGAGFPSDEALKLRGREILGSDTTAADDPSLLDKFKAWVMPLCNQWQEQQPVGMSSALPCDSDINPTNTEIDSILADASFDMTLR
ncbi:Homeobox protein 4 [Fusarium odoratissimum]|uniref:Homeobox protein 4 n=1 Tax=Fusarium oxysporum f. sp. cubense (strain race 4) TaxID=2502994 RepID=N1S8B9_FUSC4|nr:Homeobox protein 4 [Fusarium odoratissimum]